jgi:hypothetical protein
MEGDVSTKLVILEIGCGALVPSVRLEGEEVLRDFNNASLQLAREKAVLIRINPGERSLEPQGPEVDDGGGGGGGGGGGLLVLNHGGARQVLQELDGVMQLLLRAS